MNRQKSSGIALIWVLSGIVIVGIVALFIYEIVNRPPNRHIGDNKPWKCHKDPPTRKTCSLIILTIFVHFVPRSKPQPAQSSSKMTILNPAKFVMSIA